ncbi:hypothetical protein HYALB_00004557 [Hymenoscyphus albidus]|uniref:Lipid droplet-associated hydrolase n=1 Tax=Hymenoscyphus albidus TaxID=595503 RepID=A0A9N9QCF6_9HELO|nr:hypothetical protein HYALB_00004557 [Hymenoscyphus albidus]
MALRNTLSRDPSQPTINISLPSPSKNTPHHLIYFITGNPGLIGYYRAFLETLHSLLSDSHTSNITSKDVFDVYGQSLAGFDDTHTVPLSSSKTHPYSLEEVIDVSLETLEQLRIQQGPRQGQLYDSVIIIGHSVGAYISLEIIQRLKRRKLPTRITAGILLFPTVTHIAQSNSGIKISWLFKIPNFPRIASTVAKLLVSCAPVGVLKWLVGVVTDMPQEGANVTTAFLKSRMGIWQALHLAEDEMRSITEDRWDEDIWGVEHKDSDSEVQAPKLIFYFGENDHWVADHSRDVLIAARGTSDSENASSKPNMLIDDCEVPHGFCIRHSEVMAEKVRVWVDNIISNP